MNYRRSVELVGGAIRVVMLVIMPIAHNIAEQSLPLVGNIHINQLIARRKSEKEGKELVTDKWRLVVSW